MHPPRLTACAVVCTRAHGSRCARRPARPVGRHTSRALARMAPRNTGTPCMKTAAPASRSCHAAALLRRSRQQCQAPRVPDCSCVCERDTHVPYPCDSFNTKTEAASLRRRAHRCAASTASSGLISAGYRQRLRPRVGTAGAQRTAPAVVWWQHACGSPHA